MKKLFLSMLVMLCAVTTASAAFKVGNLWFEPYTPAGETPTASVVPPPTGEPSYQETLSGRVVIPSQVTYVFTNNGQSTEYNCVVNNLQGAPFQNCAAITEIVLPDALASIGGSSFQNCTGLTSINIPASVKEIWMGAFQGCINLETIVVDSNNPYYDSRSNCNAIITKQDVSFSSVTYPKDQLVFGCKGSTVPNTVTSIGREAFRYCTGLTSITFPNTLQKINQTAFEGCTGLTSITIPASVDYIYYQNPFSSCSNLETIVVDTNNPVYDSRNSCNAIIQTSSNTLVSGCKNTVIPEDVTAIGDKAFQSIPLASTVIIPEGVTSVGSSAFGNCGIIKLTLPSTLKSLGICAFSTNMNMEDVYCYREHNVENNIDMTFEYMGAAVWQQTCDEYIPGRAKLHVLPGDVEYYRNADQWKYFIVVGDLIHDAALTLSYGALNSENWTNVAFEKDANGNWTLTQELPANTEFKVFDQDDNWYGGSVGLITKGMIGSELNLSTSGSNFKIPVAGTWTFTVTPNLQTLVVTGTWNDILTLKGSFLNNWAGGKDFVLGEDGKWTITQEMQQGDEFKFVFNNTTWIGAESGNNTFTEEMIADGTPLNLIQEVNGASSVNFISPVYGNWTLTVDLENNTLVVSGQWPEPEYAHVYILGEVDKYSWDPSDAPEMNTTDGIVYTYDANFDGRGDNGENYFSFTTELGKNWDDIASFRFGAVSDGDYWFNNEQLGVPFALTYKNGQSIRILAGDYTLKVNLEDMTLTITNQSSEYPVGDVNGDYVVDVSDINILVNIILGTDNAANYDGRANVNGADDVDVSDINMVVNIMLGQNN